jgi:glycosyltransferase involved in cell wall biosynthesis
MTGPAKNLLQFATMARTMDPPVETHLATFHRQGDSTVFREAADKAGVELNMIPEQGRFDRAAMSGMSGLVRSLVPDIVQSHAVKTHFLTRCAGLHKGTKWVAFHHGYTWPDMRARLYNQLDRWSLRAAHQLVTVSLPFREQLEKQGVERGRIDVIHNAIDPGWGQGGTTAERAALRQQLAIPEGKRLGLIVGRLSREKDHVTLLRAMARARDLQSGRATHLLIVGDGPERANIEAMVRDLGLGQDVTFAGQVVTAEPYYGIADFAVLSSLSEGSPNALLEAMAAGIPVIATRVGGIPEIVEDRRSALLVPPAEVEAMARGLEILVSDSELSAGLAKRARETIVTRYSPEGRVRRLCELYRTLATGGD